MRDLGVDLPAAEPDRDRRGRSLEPESRGAGEPHVRAPTKLQIGVARGQREVAVGGEMRLGRDAPALDGELAVDLRDDAVAAPHRRILLLGRAPDPEHRQRSRACEHQRRRPTHPPRARSVRAARGRSEPPLELDLHAADPHGVRRLGREPAHPRHQAPPGRGALAASGTAVEMAGEPHLLRQLEPFVARVDEERFRLRALHGATPAVSRSNRRGSRRQRFSMNRRASCTRTLIAAGVAFRIAPTSSIE